MNNKTPKPIDYDILNDGTKEFFDKRKVVDEKKEIPFIGSFTDKVIDPALKESIKERAKAIKIIINYLKEHLQIRETSLMIMNSIAKAKAFDDETRVKQKELTELHLKEIEALKIVIRILKVEKEELYLNLKEQKDE